ncbi:hypothetical protein [Kitasatospora sp. NPDC002965]|uniref:hypothetical protein n=1 Tax=Kitasatospora sp. NPDC002965 TaxID=3154775 RepID=UPI0033BA477C
MMTSNTPDPAAPAVGDLPPPACPDCSATTLPLSVEGEQLWVCPSCGRRTYGTGDEDDDADLPSYTETGPDGAVFVHHGTGEVDIEATAEWATQDRADEDGDEDEDMDGEGGPHAGCFEPHRTADGYVGCDRREL